MRITVSIGDYTFIVSAAANYQFYFEWTSFFCEGGYPQITFDWWIFSFSVDDF